MKLSKGTSNRVDWDSITAAIRLGLGELGGEKGSEDVVVANAVSASESALSAQRITQEAFEVFQSKFQEALLNRKKVINIVIAVMLLSFAVMVLGISLSFVNPWGGAVSLAGLATLCGQISKGWQLMKDVTMLEILPSRYEFLLKMCRTPEQYDEFLAELLRETRTLRP